MKHEWQLQEAKNKLSAVIQNAINEPQTITVRGIPTVVVMSVNEYNALIKPKKKLTKFFQDSPLSELEIERISDYGRDIDL